ncbi:MAG: exodeoxyribonuclease VII large subunit [Candidatus Pelagibacter sp. TMED166]|nr:MAG: exodeoxyribonuclease VII large subunit [Candidatus Pelagibacter sp. TMED166]|tara:strand:+ start:2223 stop:3512 length:1290 start_codon:yes stop_codon:yes gene_type:complete
MAKQFIFTVSQVNTHINKLVESNFSNITVKGEISQLTVHPNGHMYFNIKDENATLPCAIFYYQSKISNYKPKVGDEVLVEGKTSFWVKGGSLKLIGNSISLAGQGDLWAKFEALKKDLHNKGLFDSKKKKKLPLYPKKIGIITSITGSVIKDILNVINRNSPYLNIVIRDCRMQGEEAVPDIITAIKDFNNLDTSIDAVILARGGGSLEDLWCFNNEKLAYEIYKSSIPIVSAIGHETDTTISDLVADKRAGTPSIAAEIIAPSVEQCLQNIDFFSDKIFRLVTNKIQTNINYMDNVKKRHGLHKIKYILSNHNDKLNRVKSQISNDKFKNKINQSLILLDKTYDYVLTKTRDRMNFNYEKLAYFSNLSSNLNPENIVKRGYSIIYKDGNLVKSVKQVDKNDNLNIKVKDGIIKTKVFKTNKGKNDRKK